MKIEIPKSKKKIFTLMYTYFILYSKKIIITLMYTYSYAKSAEKSQVLETLLPEIHNTRDTCLLHFSRLPSIVKLSISQVLKSMD